MARQYPDAPICLLGVSAGKGAAIATHCMDGGNGGDSRGGLFVTVALTRLATLQVQIQSYGTQLS